MHTASWLGLTQRVASLAGQVLADWQGECQEVTFLWLAAAVGGLAGAEAEEFVDARLAKSPDPLDMGFARQYPRRWGCLLHS